MSGKYLILIGLAVLLAACSSQPISPTMSDAEIIGSQSSLMTGVAAADSLLRQGESARSKGDYAVAVNHLERGIRMVPRSAPLYLALAKTRLAMGEFHPAKQMAQRAVSLLPAKPKGAQQTAKAEAWIVIAQAKEKLGDAQGAQQARANAQAVW